MINIENALREQGDQLSKKPLPNYTTEKRYPPYGKKLDQLRRNGLIHRLRVIVSTNWEFGKAYPRIVVTNEVPVGALRFEYLAGLSVQIVYLDVDQFFIQDLIDAIRKVNPKTLTIFNMSAVKAGKPAFKMIQVEKVEAPYAA